MKALRRLTASSDERPNLGCSDDMLDKTQIREVCTIVAAIARQKLIGVHHRVGADDEVRDHVLAVLD